MKKLAIMMAALCMSVVTLGAVSENTASELGKVWGYIKTQNITALRTLTANVKAEVEAKGTDAQKNTVSRAMGWIEVLSNPNLTLEQMREIHARCYKKGDNETKTIPYYFVNKTYNPATTDAQLEQAIAAFKQTDNKLGDATAWFIDAMIAADKSQEAYDLVTAAIKGNETKLKAGLFYSLVNLDKRIHDGMSSYIANLYFKILANNASSPITKQARFLGYANDAIAKLVTDPDTDLEAFKKQLKRIRLIYTNRMTTDAGKKLYGTFVSIIDNTIKSL